MHCRHDVHCVHAYAVSHGWSSGSQWEELRAQSAGRCWTVSPPPLPMRRRSPIPANPDHCSCHNQQLEPTSSLPRPGAPLQPARSCPGLSGRLPPGLPCCQPAPASSTKAREARRHLRTRPRWAAAATHRSPPQLPPPLPTPGACPASCPSLLALQACSHAAKDACSSRSRQRRLG